MKRIAKSVSGAAVLAAILCLAQGEARAGYVADAQISSQAVGNGSYNYTITLQNEASSTSPIGTFWFAWVPTGYGYDLLPSAPTNVQAPGGWFGFTTGGSSYYYPDGYSIEFYSYTAGPLQPGHSLTFSFTSTDSPATIQGISPYLGISAATSFLYSGGAFSDPGAQIQVSPTPEPSTMMLAGLAGLVMVGWRKLRG